jgi:transposase
VRQARKGGLSTSASKRTPVTEEEMELARLRREIAELKMERDILKNAAAYFAKESMKGARS